MGLSSTETCEPARPGAEAPPHFVWLFLLAALTGTAAGALGGLFHLSADHAEALRGHLASLAGHGAWAVSLLASAGLAAGAVLLVRRYAPEAAGSGIQEIEAALAGLRPLRWLRVLLVKFPAGVLALGSAMVLGREGPTIQMGGASGKGIAALLRTRSPYVRHCLVAAGAGAGLTAAFNAPLAGILFVVEEMREEFHFDFVSFHCVVIACAMATVACRLIAGADPAIPMAVMPAPRLAHLALFLVFGLSVGLIGVAFNAALTWTLDRFEALSPARRLLAAAAVGAVAGLCAWGLPAAAGSGHATLLQTLYHSQTARVLLGVFAVRFLLTMASYASGAPGGIFAPMLVLGTLWGVLFGLGSGSALSLAGLPPDSFAVTGMGALFAATVRAPLTGMVLILEMTGNYSLTLPLMVTCISAAGLAEALGGRPIYRILMERTLRAAGLHPGA